MSRERHQQPRPETADGVLVRPIGGQVYLVEEGTEAEGAPWDEPPAPDRSPLSGLIHRH